MKMKQVGEMSNSEFAEHIAGQVRAAYREGQVQVIDDAIYAARCRIEALLARRERLLADARIQAEGRE